jgi:hypothetical protein
MQSMDIVGIQLKDGMPRVLVPGVGWSWCKPHPDEVDPSLPSPAMTITVLRQISVNIFAVLASELYAPYPPSFLV